MYAQLPSFQAVESSSLTPSSPLHTVIGILKGYDQLLNLVMDEVEEYINGA